MAVIDTGEGSGGENGSGRGGDVMVGDLMVVVPVEIVKNGIVGVVITVVGGGDDS